MPGCKRYRRNAPGMTRAAADNEGWLVATGERHRHVNHESFGRWRTSTAPPHRRIEGMYAADGGKPPASRRLSRAAATGV